MLNLALVGCGGMANWHAQQLQKLTSDAKVAALCDTVPNNTKTFKEKYFADAKTFDSYDALLADSSLKLDGVILVTPHTLHYQQCKTALEKGINVLVEKPMVTSSEHAYDLWKIVKKTGKKLAIGFQGPYSPEYQYLIKERAAGKLGKVQIISGWMSQGWLNGTRKTWRQDPAMSGGGQMYDSGAHLLNAMMYFMNEPVVEVSCMYDKVDAPVDINGVAIFKFQGGALASVAIGGNCPAFRTDIMIQTDKMLIMTEQYGGKLEMTGANGKRVYPHIEASDAPAAGTPHANFIAAIQGKAQLQAPVRYGVLLAALMDAFYESADNQKPVKVKPVPMDI